MIVSVCADTVACAPRWRRLGFNDCKGSGFGEKHQTAKGKVASHAQPKRPSIQPPPPLSKAKPSYPAKAIFGRIFAPAKNRQEPPSPAKPPPPKNQKSALPSKEERSKISIGPHRLSGSAKHLGYLSNLRALKQA